MSRQIITKAEATAYSAMEPERWYTAYDLGQNITPRPLAWVEATQNRLNSLVRKGLVEKRPKKRSNPNDCRYEYKRLSYYD